MTTPSESAAERLIANAPHTSAAALGGNRDDLVWLLAAAYREGRFDAQGEELERHMRVLREQLREREVTPAVEFPLPTTPHSYDESERHVRVITGTGNASERRETDALCRGLKVQP